MARDHFKSRASFKSEGWTGNRGPAELGMVNATCLRSMEADLESSELASKGGSGFRMIGRVLFDFRSADNMATSGSPARSSVVGAGPVGFMLPSSDKAVRSGSRARVGNMVDP